MPSNSTVLHVLKLTASVMELHEENAFKIRAYQNAAIAIDKTPYAIEDLSDEDLSNLQGIGVSMGKKIREIVATGSLSELHALLQNTPAGLLELFDLPGIGAKKIRTLWKELGIESTAQLLEACNSNQIADQKGFGEKTQENLRKAILFQHEQSKKLLIPNAQQKGSELLMVLKTIFPQLHISWCGELYQQAEIVTSLEFIVGTNDPVKTLDTIQSKLSADWTPAESTPFTLRGLEKTTGVPLIIRTCSSTSFESQRLIFSAEKDHLRHAISERETFMDVCMKHAAQSEQELYATAGVPLIPAECRVGYAEWNLAKENKIDQLLSYKDIKGIFHNHSTYSDGIHTLAEMAHACINEGWQYFGIADHSQTAFYANGLKEDRVLQQFLEIDELNKKLAPFVIFKGIESDILNDGALDYPDELLKQFDYVVASVHSNLKMDEEKAMTRLIKAIENPHTTMLGHMTGRLLLRREGYPLDTYKIIDACAVNKVIIELNANPNRLDIDWRFLDYAQEKGVIISINPDAHEQAGILDTHYGVISARKGGLLVQNTFNTLGLEEIKDYFTTKKK
ncbi:MAG: DNA polymerase/3'-5' exonuclease PolX [Cytophagaceae bacterium]|nr:DNA polymerase/3'-5' exonuclease PolX [Cytophagaceae bacterium]